jgi:hypothetical protein
MEKEFVPYQEALELKQLGFDEPCFAFYNYNSQLCRYMNPDKDWNSLNHQQLKNSKITLPDTHTAPTYSQAFRWFREKYQLRFCIIDDHSHNEKPYSFTSEHEYYYDTGSGNDWFKSYEEAELACLQKLIELVKK